MEQAAALSDDELAALRLGGGPWLLLESPFGAAGPELERVVDGLMARGHKILLAHPERSPRCADRPQRLRALVERGARCSITAAALEGRFGAQAQWSSLRAAALRAGALGGLRRPRRLRPPARAARTGSRRRSPACPRSRRRRSGSRPAPARRSSPGTPLPGEDGRTAQRTVKRRAARTPSASQVGDPQLVGAGAQPLDVAEAAGRPHAAAQHGGRLHAARPPDADGDRAALGARDAAAEPDPAHALAARGRDARAERADAQQRAVALRGLARRTRLGRGGRRGRGRRGGRDGRRGRSGRGGRGRRRGGRRRPASRWPSGPASARASGPASPSAVGVGVGVGVGAGAVRKTAPEAAASVTDVRVGAGEVARARAEAHACGSARPGR